MDYDVLPRVLAAVGSKYTPNHVDREKLRRDLDWAGTWYRTSFALREKSKRDLRIGDSPEGGEAVSAGLPSSNTAICHIDANLEHRTSRTEKLVGFVKQAEAALNVNQSRNGQQDAAAQIVRNFISMSAAHSNGSRAYVSPNYTSGISNERLAIRYPPAGERRTVLIFASRCAR